MDRSKGFEARIGRSVSLEHAATLLAFRGGPSPTAFAEALDRRGVWNACDD